MQQEPIINHGTLIDTYNYAAMICAAANQVSANPYNKVVSSRKSKIYKKKKKVKKNLHRRMLKR